MSYTLDANVLLYASDERSPFHTRAQALLEQLADSDDLVYLFWPTVMAYLRISTHPAIFETPLAFADAVGNIGMGFSFGDATHYAGQRFAARTPTDPKGTLGFRETVLVEGQAAQGNTLRWEDYAALAMDPADDCTFWYVGDYVKKGAPTYSTRIGAFRLPGCEG